jgi:hypothetical protein
MKSLHHAWERIFSFENLVLAYRQNLSSRVSLLSAPARLRFAPVRRNRAFQSDSACRRLPTAPVAPLLGQKPATYPRRPRNRRGRQDNPYRPVSFRSPVKQRGQRSCALAPAAWCRSEHHANSIFLDVIELFCDPRCRTATGSGASAGSPPTFFPTEPHQVATATRFWRPPPGPPLRLHSLSGCRQLRDQIGVRPICTSLAG